VPKNFPRKKLLAPLRELAVLAFDSPLLLPQEPEPLDDVKE